MKRPTFRLLSLASLVLALLAAGCGDDTVLQPTTTSAAPDVVTTTTGAASTTTTAATTTTGAPTTTSATTTTTIPVTTTGGGGAAMPSGSGCSPPGNTLPDGEWFGFVEGISAMGEADLTFDLACYFEGAQADLAAAEDSHPLPLEFYPYVRNRNPKVFDLTLAAGATVDDYLMGTVSFADWVLGMPSDNGCSPDTGYSACPLWVRIQSGQVVLLYGLLPEWSGDGRGS